MTKARQESKYDLYPVGGFNVSWPNTGARARWLVGSGCSFVRNYRHQKVNELENTPTEGRCARLPVTATTIVTQTYYRFNILYFISAESCDSNLTTWTHIEYVVLVCSVKIGCDFQTESSDEWCTFTPVILNTLNCSQFTFLLSQTWRFEMSIEKKWLDRRVYELLPLVQCWNIITDATFSKFFFLLKIKFRSFYSHGWSQFDRVVS